MKVGTYHFTRVPSLKYDMDAYMATLYEGDAHDLWVKQKPWPNSQHKPQ